MATGDFEILKSRTLARRFTVQISVLRLTREPTLVGYPSGFVSGVRGGVDVADPKADHRKGPCWGRLAPGIGDDGIRRIVRRLCEDAGIELGDQ